MNRLCVFCGSRSGVRPAYQTAAQSMGQALARRGITLVYGGGDIGLMGTVADAVIDAGGSAIGVIPDALLKKEVPHPRLTELHVVGSMHERKALMADLSDGFIAMPGGFGTFEEFCEVLTWSQLGFHQKPCGLLNIENYYKPLLDLFNHAVAEEFVRPQHRALVLEATDPDHLLDQLAIYQPTPLSPWIDNSQR